MQREPGISQGLRLAVDSRGFVRRGCPVCVRQFKITARPQESLLVQSVFSASLHHENADELGGLPVRHCPYCGHRALADAFLTAAQRRYIEASARTLAGEVRFEQLQHAERHLAQNPFITFRAVRPAEAPPEQPAEPDDMRAVFLVCCAEELKIKSTWRETILCHHCRARHAAR